MSKIRTRTLRFGRFQSFELFEQFKDLASAEELQEMETEIQRHLKLPTEEKEAKAETIFRRLAVFAANKLSQKVRTVDYDCIFNSISGQPANLT